MDKKEFFLSKNSFRAAYSIFVGTGMLLVWGLLISTGRIQEMSTAPLQMIFYIICELITSLSLIISGILLLKKVFWGNSINYLALGMLFYAMINASGYYLQINNKPMVIMFLIFTLLEIIIVPMAVIHDGNHKI